MKNYTVLAIDQDPKVLAQLARALVFKIRLLTAGSIADACRSMDGKSIDYILLGQSGMGAVQAIEVLRAAAPDAQILLKTDDIDEAIPLFQMQKIARVLQLTCAPHEVEKHIQSLIDHRVADRDPQPGPQALAQGIVNTIRRVGELNDADDLLEGLPTACRTLVETLHGNWHWMHQVAVEIMPAGFGLLTSDEIAAIKRGNYRKPEFQLGLRRSFLSLSHLLSNHPELKKAGLMMASAPFTTGQIRYHQVWDDSFFPHLLHIATLWCVLSNQGLNPEVARQDVRNFFPWRSSAIDAGLEKLMPQRISTTMVPLADLKPGMVLQHDGPLPGLDDASVFGKRLDEAMVSRVQQHLDASGKPLLPCVAVANTTINSVTSMGIADQWLQRHGDTSVWGRIQFDMTRADFLAGLEL